MNQPSSIADALTVSGASSSASLIATTSPETGDCARGRGRVGGTLLARFNKGTRRARVDVRGGLDGLDGPKCLALLDLVADLGEVHEDDVPERIGGEIGDADGADAAVDGDVLVLRRVARRERAPGRATDGAGRERRGACGDEAEHDVQSVT